MSRLVVRRKGSVQQVPHPFPTLGEDGNTNLLVASPLSIFAPSLLLAFPPAPSPAALYWAVVLVDSSRPNFLRLLAAFAALLLLAAAPACKRASITKHDYMYVSAPETSLRDRVATMYNKLGTVHNGERVDVLERQKRFYRVRTDGGAEGWIEQRSLVSQEVYRRIPEAGAGRKGEWTCRGTAPPAPNSICT